MKSLIRVLFLGAAMTVLPPQEAQAHNFTAQCSDETGQSVSLRGTYGEARLTDDYEVISKDAFFSVSAEDFETLFGGYYRSEDYESASKDAQGYSPVGEVFLGFRARPDGQGRVDMRAEHHVFRIWFEMHQDYGSDFNGFTCRFTPKRNHFGIGG